MALQFSITERPDGKAFIFKDLTDYSTLSYGSGNITEMTLKIKLPDGEDFIEYELSTTGYVAQEEIEAAELNLSIFPDGVYTFVLEIEESATLDSDETDEILFGFAAIVSQKVMKASLAFQPGDTRKKREWILELQRLLNNLRYSAYTGNYNFFQDNIYQLQKIL